MIYTPLTVKAARIAYEAHHGQFDVCGMPYVFHPFHVAEQMTDEYTTCVALLHDVVEDTDVTFEDLEGEFPEEVLEALDAARGRIRSLLARALDWRVTPELEFRIDRSTDEAERIARALENVPETLSVPKDEEGYPLAADGDDAPVADDAADEGDEAGDGPSGAASAAEEAPDA